jgi:hypothetical protein
MPVPDFEPDSGHRTHHLLFHLRSSPLYRRQGFFVDFLDFRGPLGLCQTCPMHIDHMLQIDPPSARHEFFFHFSILEWCEIWRFGVTVPGRLSKRIVDHTHCRFVPINAPPGKFAGAPPQMPATVMAALHCGIRDGQCMTHGKQQTLTFVICLLRLRPCQAVELSLLNACRHAGVTVVAVPGHLSCVLSCCVMLHPIPQNSWHAFLAIQCFKPMKCSLFF